MSRTACRPSRLPRPQAPASRSATQSPDRRRFPVPTLTITGAGSVSVTASQAGNSTYAPAPFVTRSFTVAKATLTATATSFSRPVGAPDPTLTYAVTGFVHGDSSPAVSGTAALSTTATTSSPAGTYPIIFSTEGLVATNYTFTYVSGTLTVTAGKTANFNITSYPSVEKSGVVTLASSCFS